MFKPRTAIKAQALADFLAEGSYTESSLEVARYTKESWELKVNGAVNSSGVGAGLVLTSPNKKYTEMRAINLKPNLSNNQAEYEALLKGLEWAHEEGIKAIKVYSDSQLVVNQVQGIYTTQAKGLQPYVDQARKWTDKFCLFSLSLIGTKDNQQADRLVKIASGEMSNEEGIPIERILANDKEPEFIQYLSPTS